MKRRKKRKAEENKSLFFPLPSYLMDGSFFCSVDCVRAPPAVLPRPTIPSMALSSCLSFLLLGCSLHQAQHRPRDMDWTMDYTMPFGVSCILSCTRGGQHFKCLLWKAKYCEGNPYAVKSKDCQVNKACHKAMKKPMLRKSRVCGKVLSPKELDQRIHANDASDRAPKRQTSQNVFP